MNVQFYLGMLFKSLQVNLVLCRSHYPVMQSHKKTWTETKSSHKISSTSKIVPNFLIAFALTHECLHIFPAEENKLPDVTQNFPF